MKHEWRGTSNRTCSDRPLPTCKTSIVVTATISTPFKAKNIAEEKCVKMLHLLFDRLTAAPPLLWFPLYWLWPCRVGEGVGPQLPNECEDVATKDNIAPLTWPKYSKLSRPPSLPLLGRVGAAEPRNSEAQKQIRAEDTLAKRTSFLHEVHVITRAANKRLHGSIYQGLD